MMKNCYVLASLILLDFFYQDQNHDLQRQIQMSVQRFQSLPKKTQPTLNSSLRPNNTTANKFYLKIHPQCPETSEFRLNKQPLQARSREKIYIHNLLIDYGRLQKPNPFNMNVDSYANQSKLNEIDTEQNVMQDQMQTKRVTGISSFIDQSFTQKKKSSALKVEVDYHKTEQTRISTIDNMLPICSSVSKPKIKLQEVRAYGQTLKGQSNRKRLHSRIVKMVNGGGSKKTKVICYPDRTEYQRLFTQK